MARAFKCCCKTDADAGEEDVFVHTLIHLCAACCMHDTKPHLQLHSLHNKPALPLCASLSVRLYMLMP